MSKFVPDLYIGELCSYTPFHLSFLNGHRYYGIRVYLPCRLMACRYPHRRICALPDHQYGHACARRGATHNIRQFRRNLVFYSPESWQVTVSLSNTNPPYILVVTVSLDIIVSSCIIMRLLSVARHF